VVPEGGAARHCAQVPTRKEIEEVQNLVSLLHVRRLARPSGLRAVDVSIYSWSHSPPAL
jgi:hypothetical protein